MHWHHYSERGGGGGGHHPMPQQYAHGGNGREDGQYAMQRDGSYRREDGQYSMQQQYAHGDYRRDDGPRPVQQQYAHGDYRRDDGPRPMQQQYAHGDYRRDDGPRPVQQQYAHGDYRRDDGPRPVQQQYAHGDYRRDDGPRPMQQQYAHGDYRRDDGPRPMQQQYAHGDYYRRDDGPRPVQQQYAHGDYYRRDDGPRPVQRHDGDYYRRDGHPPPQQRHDGYIFGGGGGGEYHYHARLQPQQMDGHYGTSSPPSPSAASSLAVSSSNSQLRKRKAHDPTTTEECASASSSSGQSLLGEETMLELAQLHVGGLNDGIDNRLVMHWVRGYGPFVDFTRPSPSFAFITLLETNAIALLEAVAMHNVTVLPCSVTIERARNPRPMDPSVSIGDQLVCRAFLNGHCLRECPFHLTHPLHDDNIDYDAMLSGRERKKLKTSHTKSENDEGATQLVQRVSDLDYKANEESDPFDTQSIYSSSGSTVIPTDDPDETWSIRSSLNASSYTTTNGVPLDLEDKQQTTEFCRTLESNFASSPATSSSNEAASSCDEASNRVQSTSNQSPDGTLTLPPPLLPTRLMNSLEEMKMKLEVLLQKTKDDVNKGMTLSPSDLQQQEAISNCIKQFAEIRFMELQRKCDSTGHYPLTSVNGYNKQATYLIKKSEDPEKDKIGAAFISEFRRILEQLERELVPTHAAEFTKTEDTLALAGSNPALQTAIVNFREVSSVSKSYKPLTDEHIATALDECTVGASFRGDPNVVGEMYLSPGSDYLRKVLRRPEQGRHDDLVLALNDVEDVHSIMAWPTTKNQLYDGIHALSEGPTLAMMNTMFRVPTSNEPFQFLKYWFVAGQLLSQPGMAFTNACSSFIFDSIKQDAEDLLRNIKTMKDDGADPNVIRRVIQKSIDDTLGDYNLSGPDFYKLEMKLSGNKERIAKGTVKVLGKMIKRVNASGNKSLILIEYLHFTSLQVHASAFFMQYFSTLVGPFVRPDGKTAGMLFRATDLALVAVHNSYHVISAPGTATETAISVNGSLITIKSVLAEANLQHNNDVERVLEQARAYALQLEWQDKLGGSKYPAIVNYTPDGIVSGRPERAGLQAMIDWISNRTPIDGCHPIPFGAFVMNLGYDGLKDVLEILGYDSSIDSLLQEFFIDLTNVPRQLPIVKAGWKVKEGSSKYVGASYLKSTGKIRATIRLEGKARFIGYYPSYEEAGVAYATAVYKYRGQDALDEMRRRYSTAIDLTNVPRQLPIVGGRNRYVGICKDRNEWKATISIDGENRCIGLYPTDEEAGVAFAMAVFHYRGQDALDAMRRRYSAARSS